MKKKFFFTLSFIIIFSLCGCNEKTKQNAISLSNELVGESELVITPIPTPEPTPTPAPTPTPTPEPTPTPTPTPAPTPTSEPTPTPAPTPTPEPTPPTMPTPSGKIVYRTQMGDNVWYTVYDDGQTNSSYYISEGERYDTTYPVMTLVIEGSGSTWDFKNDYYNYGYFYTAYEAWENGEGHFPPTAQINNIIVQEGISRLGDGALVPISSTYPVEVLYLPSTLKEIGEDAFYGTITNDWDFILERLDNLLIASSAFSFTNLDDLAEVDVSLITQINPAWTKPTPDPDNPKMIHSIKNVIGENITIEIWDNGYMYIKGSGATYDMPWHFILDSYNTEQLKNKYWKNERPISNITQEMIKYIVVEEGITYLGNNTISLRNVHPEVWLPKSLVKESNSDISASILHMYVDGKPITATTDITAVPHYILVPSTISRQLNGESLNIEITWDN